MNALTSKSSFGKAAAGLMAVAALTTALTLAPANDVEAQQPQNVSAAPTANVPVRDIRDSSGITDKKGQEAVVTIAAMASKDGQVLVLYGGNEQVWNSMIKAAQKAKIDGLPIKGAILASPLPEKIVNGYHIGSPNLIQLFADGRLTASIDSPTANVDNMVLERLRLDHEKVVLPRRASRDQLASAPTITH